jgi:hypothetical protein
LGAECLRESGSAVRQKSALRQKQTLAYHSITSSAVARSVGGTSSLRLLAVFRLVTNSNFVRRETGKSFVLSSHVSHGWSVRKKGFPAFFSHTLSRHGLRSSVLPLLHWSVAAWGWHRLTRPRPCRGPTQSGQGLAMCLEPCAPARRPLTIFWPSIYHPNGCFMDGWSAW